MLDFLKQWFGKGNNIEIPENADEASYEELTGVKLDEPQVQTDNKQDGIETTLYLHPSWEEEIDQDQKYILNLIHSKLPQIKKAIFFHPFHVETIKDGYRVTLFIRNGLEKNLILKEVPLTLINDGKVVASGKFSLKELGEIPSHGSMPWRIEFKDEMVFQLDIHKFGKWGTKVQYHKPKKVKLDQLQLHPEWEKTLSKEQIKGLHNVIKELPPIPYGRVEFWPIEASFAEDEGIVTTMLICNGFPSTVQLQNTPILLTDEDKGDVAAGMFNLNGLQIKPGAAMPWNFYFKGEDVINNEFNLNRLKVIHGARQVGNLTKVKS